MGNRIRLPRAQVVKKRRRWEFVGCGKGSEIRGLNLGFLGEIEILFRREERTGVTGVIIIGDSIITQRKVGV